MRSLFERLERILSFDPGQRGLLGWLPSPEIERAAELLKSAEDILIVTGFPIMGMGIGETDGPVGAASLAKACFMAGKKAYIVTDSYSSDIVKACLRGVMAENCPVYVLDIDKGESGCVKLVRRLKPSLIVAIERPGKGHDGHFHNMHGNIIDNMVADTDALLKAGIPTIAIGDGGNELGMGNYYDIIRERVPSGAVIGARETSDAALVCGVSNWWGWGLAAVLSGLYGKDCLTSADEEYGALRLMVQAGGVDGVLKKQIMSVDGIELGGISEIHGRIKEAIGLYFEESLGQNLVANVI
ncbi:MAG: DUF4392 domain-containing protein [Clostridiaceae bacterium]|nr:DUF4392 domain-containing protein [Clostridiaceae bacterium]